MKRCRKHRLRFVLVVLKSIREKSGDAKQDSGKCSYYNDTCDHDPYVPDCLLM